MHGRWVKEADNIGPEPGRPGAKEFLRQLARAKSMPDDVCDMQNLANAYYYKLLDEGGRGYPFFGERGNGGFSNRCVATPDKPNGNPSSCAFSYPGFPNTTTEASTCRLKIFGENAALELQWCMTNIIGTMKIAPPGGYVLRASPAGRHHLCGPHRLRPPGIHASRESDECFWWHYRWLDAARGTYLL